MIVLMGIELIKTSVEGLFVVGEAAGTHGVKRPGGSALNAGQVGALRAALFIAENFDNELPLEENALPYITKALQNHALEKTMLSGYESNISSLRGTYTVKMSDCAAAIRNMEQINGMRKELGELINGFFSVAKVSSKTELFDAYRLYDSPKTQYACLGAMLDYTENGGRSRGSAIYLDSVSEFASLLVFDEDNGALDGKIQETGVCGCDQSYFWRDVRPLSEGGGVFENIWREYRNGDIFKN
jgi:succinate dehydrogenase/fumarate reductase flavoprotein subunit